ncbi:MAG: hypothetical protein ACTSQE_06860 [Candidatus Heimdallarchaeaceae archaeon]
MKKETTILLFIIMLVFVLVSMSWNISLKAGIKEKEQQEALEIEYQAKISEGRELRLQEILGSIKNTGMYTINILDDDGEISDKVILIQYKIPIEELIEE